MGTVTTITVWWDQDIKLWTIQQLDAEGDQVGNAQYDVHKSTAIMYATIDATNLEHTTGTRPTLDIGKRGR